MVVLIAALHALCLTGSQLPAVLGVDGKRHQPLIEAQGKPSIFVFISHDCPVCNVYAPELGRIEARFGSKFAFHLVYSEPRITADVAKQHAKSYKIDHAKLLLDNDCRFAAASGAKVTPEVVIFNAQGRSVYKGRIDDRYYGIGQQRPVATKHDTIEALEAVLSNQSPKPAAGLPVGCFILPPTTS